MDPIRLATVWLGGCSGCHMSFLDLDEWLITLAEQVRLVYSPIADIKEYPEGVDVVLIEGAVANDEHLHLILRVDVHRVLRGPWGSLQLPGVVLVAAQQGHGFGPPVDRDGFNSRAEATRWQM